VRRYRPQRRPAEFLHITRTQNETLEGIAVGSLSFSLSGSNVESGHHFTIYAHCMSVFLCYIIEYA